MDLDAKRCVLLEPFVVTFLLFVTQRLLHVLLMLSVVPVWSVVAWRVR